MKELFVIKDSHPKGITYSNGIIYIICTEKVLFVDYKNVLRPNASLTRQTATAIMERFRLATTNQINNLSANDMKKRVKQYHDGLAGTPQKPKLRALEIDDIQKASAIACTATDSQEDIIFVATADGIFEYSIERLLVTPKSDFAQTY